MTDEARRYQKSLAAPPPGHPAAALLDSIRPGEKVLDVGCGSGEVGAYLAAAGAVVDGVEMSPERAALAATRLRVVEQAAVGEEFDGGRLEQSYDTILLVDVVEHFVDPAPALTWCRHRLGGGGRVLCLLPNSAHYKFRQKILRGDWSYQDQGLFDRDHVRFYDVRTASDIPARAGLEETSRRYFGRFPRWVPAPLRPLALRRWNNLLAYYMLLEWRPSSEPPPSPS